MELLHIFFLPLAIMTLFWLSDLGLELDFQSHSMTWMDRTIQMKPRSSFLDTDITWGIPDPFDDDESNEPVNEAHILDAKYDPVSATEVADQQTHLSDSQRNQLENILAKYPSLFDGKLGRYPHRKIHLELEPNSTPVHS